MANYDDLCVGVLNSQHPANQPALEYAETPDGEKQKEIDVLNNQVWQAQERMAYHKQQSDRKQAILEELSEIWDVCQSFSDGEMTTRDSRRVTELLAEFSKHQ